jgi:hypothetical protein
MLTSRDPDGLPEISQEMLDRAKRLSMHVVQVFCEEPDVRVGDASGITFLALVPFLPQKGDRIELEDGSQCKVKRSYFRVVTQRGPDGKAVSITMWPSVLAERTEPNDDD